MGRRSVALALVVLAACGSERAVTTLAPSPTPPLFTTGTWRDLPPIPGDAKRFGPPAWTGAELIVWSAESETPSYGAAYRPVDDEWRTLPAPPKPVRGVPVWTGTDVVYWGGLPGSSPYGEGAALNEGAAYNPTTGAWRSIAAAPIPGRTGHEAVWTDKEMLVWGGMSVCCSIDSTIHESAAAAYDPVADEWRKLPDVPNPWSGDDGPAVSLVHDGRLLVWRRAALGTLDTETNGWTALAKPKLRTDGCMSTNGPESAATTAGDYVLAWTGGCSSKSGFAYDLSRDTWRPIAEAPSDVENPIGIGDAVYVVGGYDTESRKFMKYSLADDKWDLLPPAPRSVGRRPFVVWTGNELLAWGGFGKGGNTHTGGAFDPVD